MSHPFPFLELPDELRGKLLDLYFEDYLVKLCEYDTENPEHTPTPKTTPLPTQGSLLRVTATIETVESANLAMHEDDPWQVFQVSKQMSVEAGEALYRTLKNCCSFEQPRLVYQAFEVDAVVLRFPTGGIYAGLTTHAGMF